jgi:hypothetical protein
MPIAGTHRRWRRATQALVLVAIAVGTLLPAAPAMAAAMRVRDVTIDCAGDIVAGHVTMTSAATGTMTAELYVSDTSRTTSKMTKIGSTTVKTGEWMNEVAYTFTLAKHYKWYRVKATIGSSSRISAAVGDPTCAPPAQVSEAGAAGLLLLVMGAAAAGVLWFRSRSASRAGISAA